MLNFANYLLEENFLEVEFDPLQLTAPLNSKSSSTFLSTVAFAVVPGTPGDDDPLDGTADDDEISGEDGNDVINGLGGNDIINGGGGNDTVNGDDGNDTLFGDLGNDLLFGGSGDDTLDGGGGASDTLDGGDGIDTASYSNSSDRVIVNLQDGTASNGQATGDTLLNIENLTGSAFNDILTGDAGDNELSGGDGDDVLFGVAGFDRLNGGNGNDTISLGTGRSDVSGGSGDDTFIITSNVAFNTSFNGNDGFDTLELSFDGVINLSSRGANFNTMEAIVFTDVEGQTGPIETTIRLNVSTIGRTFSGTITGNNGDIDNVIIGYSASPDTSTDVSNWTFVDWEEQDSFTLQGDDNARTFIGPDVAGTYNAGGGNDTIIAGLGDDVIDGGSGDDALDGGEGIDTAIYSGARADYAVVDNGDGTFTITDNVGTDGIDTLTDIELLAFSDETVDIEATVSIIGSQGDDDPLNGTEDGDIINGLEGNDNIFGLEGNDTLIGGEGDDTLNGGTGDDTAVYSGASGDYDVVDNLDGTYTITDNVGSDGVDTLTDVEFLAFSDETVDIETAALNLVLINGSEGNDDPLNGTTSSDLINGLGGDDVINGLTGNDILNGGDGNDTLAGEGGADTLDGGAGSDTADYSASTNRVIVDLAAGTAASGHAVGDTLISIENLTGSAFGDIFTGDDGSNVINGLDGNDTIDGGAGNDTLIGGNGVDTLLGGEGDDIFTLNGLLANAIGEVFDGGAGTDTLVFDDNGNHTHSLRDDTILSIEALLFTDPSIDGSHTVELLSSQFETGGISLNATITADGFSDTTETFDILMDTSALDLSGLVITDTRGTLGFSVIGTAANEDIVGSTVDDVLIGGGGADTLDGGTGIDTADYSTSTNRVIIDLAAGTAASGHAIGDTLISIENLTGSAFGDILTGDAGDNVFTGGVGNDTIDGGDGDDTAVYSGDLDDYRIVVNSDGTVSVTDIVDADGIDTLTDIEFLVFSDGSVNVEDLITGTPGDDDPLNGTEGVDIINGFEGNDNIFGFGSDDTLNGGEGNDTLNGGVGGDRLEGGLGDDVLNGDDGSDTLLGDEGADRVFGGIGNDTIIFDTGDIAVGQEFIDGGTQDLRDIMQLSGTGGDIFDLRGSTVLSIEEIEFSSPDDDGLRIVQLDSSQISAVGIATDVQIDGFSSEDDEEAIEIYLDTNTLDLSGWTFQDWGTTARESNQFDSEVISIFGSATGDNITGSSQRDVINGGNGNDTIIAGDGDDILEGGAGADVLDGGDGIDTILYSGATNRVEVSLLNGTGDINQALGDTYVSIENVIGSNFADTIRGDNGDNEIDGGNGNDVLIGFNGDDVLLGGAGRDIITGGDGADIIDGGEGVDQARYNSSSEGVQIDLLAGTASGGQAEGDVLTGIESLFGSNHDDILFGDGSNNRLFGNAGDDALAAGGGVSRLTGGSGADTFVLSDGFGFVIDFVDDVDQLDVSAYGFTSLADVIGNLEQVGAHARFRVDDDVLFVLNTDIDDLANDILF